MQPDKIDLTKAVSTEAFSVRRGRNGGRQCGVAVA